MTRSSSPTTPTAADTGPGTTGGFGADVGSNGVTIATVAIDPACNVVSTSG